MYYRWRSHRNSVPTATPVVVGTMGLFAVLLIVFLACSQRVSMPGTPITLPRFENEKSTPVPKKVVTVTKNGDIFFNAEKLKDTDALGQVLKNAKKGKEDWVVVFYADKDTPLGFIAKLFDIARGADFNAYLATDGNSLRDTPSHVPAQDDKSL